MENTSVTEEPVFGLCAFSMMRRIGQGYCLPQGPNSGFCHSESSNEALTMKYVFAAIILLGLLYIAFEFGVGGSRYLRYGNRMADGLVNSYRNLHGMAPASSAPASSTKENEGAAGSDSTPAQPPPSQLVRNQPARVANTAPQFHVKRDSKLPGSLGATVNALPADPPAGGSIHGTTIVSDDPTAQSLGQAARRAREDKDR
jgi:hypothetical protein